MVTTAPSREFKQRIQRIIREQDAQDVARIRGIKLQRHEFPSVSTKPKPAPKYNVIPGRCRANLHDLKPGSDRCLECYRAWRKTRRLQKTTRAADDP